MSVNIVNLLLKRERGFRTTGWDKASQFSAENSLFCDDRGLEVRNLRVPESEYSTYVMDSTVHGEAAVARTNHSIVFVDTVRMRLIGRVHTECRTIWTLAYHPHDPDLLVAGSLGGSVFVFKGHVVHAQCNFNNEGPITSVCFYPHKEEHVIFSHSNFVYVWNYLTGNIMAKMQASRHGRVRFVKYNLLNDMLITAIECTKLRLNLAEMMEVNDNTEYFMSRLMRSLDYILNELELERDLQVAGCTWRKLIKELNTLPPAVFNEPWPFVENDLTLKIFDRRLQAIIKTHNLRFNSQPDGKETKLNQRLRRARMFNTFFSTLSARSLFLDFFVQIGRCVQALCTDENIDLTDHHWDYTWMGYSIQAWHFSEKYYPDLTENWKNVICACSMHNDSTVAISKCGKFLATASTNNERIEVHSVDLTNLGQKLFTYETGLIEKIVSLSFSPSSRFLLVSARLNVGRTIFLDLSTDTVYEHDDSLPMRLVRQFQCVQLVGVTCTRWLPNSGEKILVGFNDDRLCYIR